jgi:hypothetical protein
MSYRLIFAAKESVNLFSFSSMEKMGEETVFYDPEIITYVQVDLEIYSDFLQVVEKDIPLPGVKIDKVFVKDGVVRFIPEESPQNVVYTMRL